MYNILNELKESVIKGFRVGFNLARYGKLKRPVIKEEIDRFHKRLAHGIFNSSCIDLNESGQLSPLFFLINDKKFSPILIRQDSKNHIDIEAYASMVINLADEQDAEAIIFVSEQWTVKRNLSDKEAEEFQQGKLLPSLDPNRQEVLTLLYLTSKGKLQILIGEIERTPDNTPFVRESSWEDARHISIPFLQPWR